MDKCAVIPGITGQDGSYLGKSLVSLGYEVHGIIRHASTFNARRIDHIYREPHHRDNHLFLQDRRLNIAEPITNLMYNFPPDEIYHQGAQSHAKVSFEIREYIGDTAALGTC